MCVVAQAVFAVHKTNLPTQCSTRTDVCVVAQAVWAVFVVHKDNLSLSAQQGLMCVCVVAQAVWTVFVVHKDNLPT